MVLLGRADTSEQAGSSVPFDESSNSDGMQNSVYENLVMRGKSEENKAAELLRYLLQ